MNPYLRASLICFAFCCLILYFIWGCAGYTAVGVCRHEVTYAISVVGEKYPVRVAVGPWGVMGEHRALHAQAQMWLDGEWQYLCVDFPAVSTCAREPEFDPNQYYAPWVWNIQRISVMVKENRPK